MVDRSYPKIIAERIPRGNGDFTVDREVLIQRRLELDGRLDGPTITAIQLWEVVASLVPEMDLANGYLARRAEADAKRIERAQLKGEIREVLEEVLAEREKDKGNG